MIKDIIKPSVNYFKTRESKPLSSLFKIVSEISNIFENAHNNLCNNVINNKNSYIDNSQFNSNISSIIKMVEEYFSSITEVDIKLNEFVNSNLETAYINNDLLKLSYVNINEYNDDVNKLYINDILYSNQNYNNILNVYNMLKKENVDILKNINTDIFSDSNYKCIDNVINLINYLYYIDYYNNTITNKYTIYDYINYSFILLENKMKSIYYKLLLDECEKLNEGTDYITINALHEKYINMIENVFILEVKSISENISDYINKSKFKVKSTIENINKLDDDFILEINENIDHIALSRYLNNTDLSLSMDMINEFSIDESKLFLNGNEYTKNNLLEFLNNTINSMNILLEEFNNYISNINYNFVEFDTNKSEGLFGNDKIFLFCLNDYINYNDILKYKVEKYGNVNLNNRSSDNYVENIFKNIGSKLIKDDLLDFSYSHLCNYENTYDRKITPELNNFLLLKYRYLNKKELPNFNSINDLTSQYNNILPKNLIPLDLLRRELICQNSDNSNIISFNLDTKQTRNITNSIYGYIKLINEELL